MLFALAAVLVMAGLACSSDDDDTGETALDPTTAPGSPSPVSGQPSSVQPPEGGAVTPENSVIEVEISGARFLENNLQMPLGEPVTIRVTNSDGQDHNMRFAGLDATYDTEDDALVAPDPVAPNGGTSELTYAPALPGEYTFRCDFHPGSMGGTVTVQ